MRGKSVEIVNILEIKEGHVPVYKHDTDCCCDCMAAINGTMTIAPKCMATIPLGFAIELPVGYEAQIRPRSGLARNFGVFAVLGTVDEAYRGEVCAIMCNFSDVPFEIHDGDRICQMKISPYQQFGFNKVPTLSETDRGSNGFGSTGI